jgi:hypothetical protein
MTPHSLLSILQQAANSKLPQQVNDDSEIPVSLVGELVAAGYLEAVNASTSDGPCFVNPTITILGREYLRTLESRAREASVTGKVSKQFPALAKWLFGIVAAVAAALLVKWLAG